MQKLNIDVTKIDKSELYQGKKGTYLSLTLFENKQGPDQYGNDGFITQDISQKRREAGQKGPIIGNWKHVGKSQPGRDRTAADAYRKMHGSEKQVALPQDVHNQAKADGYQPKPSFEEAFDEPPF